MADQKTLDQIAVDLSSKMDVVMNDLGTLVDEVSKDYALLSADAQVHGPDGAVEFAVDVILKKFPLPWYVPESFVHGAIEKVLAEVIENKKA